MDNTQTVVVGAGPSGLLAAREIAQRGIEVKVVEEHPVIGEPNHCAGIISVEGLRLLGVKPSEDFVQHDIIGGRIYSPSGIEIAIRGNRTRAYAIDRAVFDRFLAETAEEEGVEVETRRQVDTLMLQNGKVEGVRGKSWEIRAQVVVDAEGATAILANRAGLTVRKTGVLAGVNVEVSGVDVEAGMVEVWLGGYIAPGLFTWVIPLKDGVARCGLACNKGDAYERLKTFIDRRFSGAKCSTPRRGFVLTGGPVRRTYWDGLLLAGDVAGQTKPTTGGGVILGGLCALEAGKTAVQAVEADDCSARFLQRYQKAWKASLGSEFASMSAARRLMNKLSDDRLDRLFDAFHREGLEWTLYSLVDDGDMDMQSDVIRSTLMEPRLRRILLRVVGRLALGELRALFNL